MNYFLSALKNYTNFSGRARRAEYWMYLLISNVIQFVITLALFLTFGENSSITTFVPLILGLFFIVPTISLIVRRLHDSNKSGWMYFVNLIPVIGSIWFLVLLCTDGTPNANKFGENPKEVLL